MKSFQKLFMKRIIMNKLIDNIRSVKSINDLNKENDLNKQVL